MRLYLIRHPLPAVAPGTCYGITNLGLAEDAHVAAARLRPHVPADAPVFSSPLQRCRLLAEALHPAPIYDERLAEMNFGDWEMQSWSDIGRTALDGWAADPLGFVPPGGESAAQLFARVAAFHEALLASDHTEAVLVVHAGIMKAMCGLRQQLPAAEWMKLDFGYGELTILESPAGSRAP